jgi:hypothetical protein
MAKRTQKRWPIPNIVEIFIRNQEAEDCSAPSIIGDVQNSPNAGGGLNMRTFARVITRDWKKFYLPLAIIKRPQPSAGYRGQEA